MKLDCHNANLNKALGAAASSSTGDGSAKVENQIFLNMKQKLGITQSMKNSLEKQVNTTETLHKDMAAENKAKHKKMLKQVFLLCSRKLVLSWILSGSFWQSARPPTPVPMPVTWTRRSLI